VRRGDLERFVGDLAEPVRRFVDEARVRSVLLINGSGQVLAQHGFTRALDVTGVAALAAGIHASSRALAQLMEQEGFDHLHQGGAAAQVFIAPFSTPAEELILITVFGEDSSIGMVRLFFVTFGREVGGLPGWQTVRPTADAESFEKDLEAGLERVFGNQS
jgi:predicted regulator of Ras-like GTPase activity (Roadblock/LC7/MglB family)